MFDDHFANLLLSTSTDSWLSDRFDRICHQACHNTSWISHIYALLLELLLLEDCSFIGSLFNFGKALFLIDRLVSTFTLY